MRAKTLMRIFSVFSCGYIGKKGPHKNRAQKDGFRRERWGLCVFFLWPCHGTIIQSVNASRFLPFAARTNLIWEASNNGLSASTRLLKFAFLGQLSGGSYTNSLALLVNIASCPSRTRPAAQIYTTWPPRWMTPIVSRKRACERSGSARRSKQR